MPRHKKWQEYNVISSVCLGEIQGLGGYFGAILDIIMRYFEVNQ